MTLGVKRMERGKSRELGQFCSKIISMRTGSRHTLFLQEQKMPGRNRKRLRALYYLLVLTPKAADEVRGHKFKSHTTDTYFHRGNYLNDLG